MMEFAAVEAAKSEVAARAEVAKADDAATAEAAKAEAAKAEAVLGSPPRSVASVLALPRRAIRSDDVSVPTFFVVFSKGWKRLAGTSFSRFS